MILVDTTVWIDHLRKSDPDLRNLLETGKVLMHSMIIGELACGHLPNRREFVRQLNSMPALEECGLAEVLAMIDSKSLIGRGIGYIDAHLICSVLNRNDATIWTRDGSLKDVAEDLGIAYSMSP